MVIVVDVSLATRGKRLPAAAITDGSSKLKSPCLQAAVNKQGFASLGVRVASGSHRVAGSRQNVALGSERPECPGAALRTTRC